MATLFIQLKATHISLFFNWYVLINNPYVYLLLLKRKPLFVEQQTNSVFLQTTCGLCNQKQLRCFWDLCEHVVLNPPTVQLQQKPAAFEKT